MSRKIRHIIGLLFILIAIIMLVWGEHRFPRQTKTVMINPTDGTVSPSYILVLDAPTRIRTGDADYIRLKISPDGLEGDSPSASDVNNKNPDEESVANDAIHNILAETRLELNGVLFEPTGDIVTSFQPDRALSFYWTVQPQTPGVYQGILWLHFQYVAMDGSEIQRKLVSRQLIEMTSLNFVGLRGDTARFAGGIGFFLGLALDIDLWLVIYQNFKERQRK